MLNIIVGAVPLTRPELTGDLETILEWADDVRHDASRGRLFGVRLVETTEAKIFEGAGASGADVASVIVLGQYAYGVTSLKGAKPRVIVKPAGSAGTADPLDQISTVGWKMDGFGAKLLQPEYAVRIECGFSA